MLARLAKVPAFYKGRCCEPPSTRRSYTQSWRWSRIKGRSGFSTTSCGPRWTAPSSARLRRRRSISESPQPRTQSPATSDFLHCAEGKTEEREAQLSHRQELYAQKFAYDIGSGYTAEQLYMKAGRKKPPRHDRMEKLGALCGEASGGAAHAWRPGLELIRAVITELSKHHTTPAKFVETIRQQIPELGEVCPRARPCRSRRDATAGGAGPRPICAASPGPEWTRPDRTIRPPIRTTTSRP